MLVNKNSGGHMRSSRKGICKEEILKPKQQKLSQIQGRAKAERTEGAQSTDGAEVKGKGQGSGGRGKEVKKKVH